MAGTTGLEPATSAVTGQRSNQLSYVPTGAARLGSEPMQCRKDCQRRSPLGTSGVQRIVRMAADA